MQLQGTKYYIFGGETAVGPLGDLWTLELGIDTVIMHVEIMFVVGQKGLWTKMEPYTKGPPRRTGHTATIVGKHMFIFGCALSVQTQVFIIIVAILIKFVWMICGLTALVRENRNSFQLNMAHREKHMGTD